MTRLIRAKARAWAPAALIVLVVLLAAGTIYNQLAINATNVARSRIRPATASCR
jgi:hypothetical protein